MSLSEFEEDLRGVLAKHKKAIFAVPTYEKDKDGVWRPSAELKWGDVKEEPKHE